MPAVSSSGSGRWSAGAGGAGVSSGPRQPEAHERRVRVRARQAGVEGVDRVRADEGAVHPGDVLRPVGVVHRHGRDHRTGRAVERVQQQLVLGVVQGEVRERTAVARAEHQLHGLHPVEGDQLVLRLVAGQPVRAARAQQSGGGRGRGVQPADGELAEVDAVVLAVSLEAHPPPPGAQDLRLDVRTLEVPVVEDLDAGQPGRPVGVGEQAQRVDVEGRLRVLLGDVPADRGVVAAAQQRQAVPRAAVGRHQQGPDGVEGEPVVAADDQQRTAVPGPEPREVGQFLLVGPGPRERPGQLREPFGQVRRAEDDPDVQRVRLPQTAVQPAGEFDALRQIGAVLGRHRYRQEPGESRNSRTASANSRRTTGRNRGTGPAGRSVRCSVSAAFMVDHLVSTAPGRGGKGNGVRGTGSGCPPGTGGRAGRSGGGGAPGPAVTPRTSPSAPTAASAAPGRRRPARRRPGRYRSPPRTPSAARTDPSAVRRPAGPARRPGRSPAKPR